MLSWHFTLHDAIMTKVEEPVIKLKTTRQQPGNVLIQRMGGHSTDGGSWEGHAHEAAPILGPPWIKNRLDSRLGQLAPSTHSLSRNNAIRQPGKNSDSKTPTLLSKWLKLCAALCALVCSMNMFHPSRSCKGNSLTQAKAWCKLILLLFENCRG